MTTDHPVFATSVIVATVLWTLSYVLIIRRGILDRTWGMPFAALCLNLSYELTFGLILPTAPPSNYANIAYFVVDLIIAAQYLSFGRRAFPNELPSWTFVPSFLICVGISVGVCVALTQDLGLERGNSYAGWTAQFLISTSYIPFLLKRQGLEGQSLYIVLTRLLGSILIIPAQEIEAPGLRVLQVLYGGFIFFDLIYLMLYVRRCRALGVNPWRRL